MKPAPKVIPRKPLTLQPIERPIVDALKTLAIGMDEQEDEPLIKASAEWRDIISQVRQYGGKGELIIRLVANGNAGKQVAVVCSIAAKRPIRKPAARLLYADSHGDVTTMDPDQMEFADDFIQEASHA